MSCNWFVYAPGRKQTTTTLQNQVSLLIFAHAHEPKFGVCQMFFCETILIFFILALLFSLAFLRLLYAVLLPTLSSFFYMELWLANFFWKGTNLIFKE